jgi:hypothetical protein
MIFCRSFQAPFALMLELIAMLSVSAKVQEWLRSEIVDDSPDNEELLP